MNNKITMTIIGCFLSLMLVTSSNSATVQTKQKTKYNGYWWRAINHDEQTGFINGYLNCYIFDYKGSDRFSRATNEYVYSISQYYKNGQSFIQREAVANLLLSFRDPASYVVIDKYAEPSSRPYGGNDGLYWMEMSENSGPQYEQRGYIAGYLSCLARFKHKNSVTFSKPVGVYVKLITQWYGFNRVTGDINGKRQPTPIADVLLMFRDRSQSKNTKSK